MKMQTKFFLMLLFLSFLMGAGTVAPGLIKIRSLEADEAESYLRDRNALLDQDAREMYGVLSKAGVLQIESYIYQGIGELSRKYQAADPDRRVSSFVVDTDGNTIMTWRSQASMPAGSEFSEILALPEDGYFTVEGSKNRWQVVKRTNSEWDWTLLTTMSEEEMYRESWSYLWFVLLISFLVLIAVLLIYVVLTGKIRDRYTYTLERIQGYRGELVKKYFDVDSSDEIGVLQENINSMIEKIGDETEIRRKTEVALAKAKTEAERANKAKSLFLANMSHEIRNPLNAIVGFSEVLASTELNTRQAGFVANISHASDILTATLSDVLALSKIESGEFEVNNEMFDLADEVKKIFGLFSPQGEEKGLEMVCNITDDIPQQLFGERTRITQILTNLLQNAIKFTELGNVTLRLELIEQVARVCKVRFVISDTGVGIHADEQSRIFESFSQIENVSTQHLSGVGLGLAIVKKLVDLLEGEITLTSVPGEGSMFTVEIPLVVQHSTSDGVALAGALPKSLESITILIVDDDILNQTYVEESLNSRGIRSVKAGNGRQAIQVLEKQDIDLVFMDIRMPVMSGVEAMVYIRNEMTAPVCNVPIVVLTANVFETDIAGYLQAGANSCVHKPVRSDVLLDVIFQTLAIESETGNT